jgi:hypothetical protein
VRPAANNDVPALRSLAELYSIDRLIHRTSLLYLQIYADRFEGKDIEATHQFLNLIFTASIKQYLSESTHLIEEEEFLERLSSMILRTVMESSLNSTGSVIPLRPS